MRNLFSLVMAFSVIALGRVCADEVLINGGKLIPISSNTVESATYHLNFVWAHRFSDGTIFLSHSAGVHAVDEHGCSEYSTDNGVTWKKPEKGIGTVNGINAYENLKGEKCSVGCSSRQDSDVHTVVITERDKATNKPKTRKCEVKFPYVTSVGFLHRDCIRLSDGRLIVSGYGRKVNAAKLHNFLLESKDDGQTWQFLSLIADDEAKKTVEGPDETTIVELKDKSILAIYRVDGNGPAKQKRSTDGGKTWSAEENSVSFGASPHAIKLADGTLAVVTGRPNLYLFVDFTGTGKNYQKICIYKGSTSSYASIIETAPSEIAIFYDESDFGSSRNSSLFNRIVVSRFKLVQDPSIVLLSFDDDPRAKEYTVFYSPAVKRLPQDLRIATNAGYRKKSEDDQAYLEIVEIPERPHPVLRMVSMREGSTRHGSCWSSLRSTNNPDNATKVKVDYEVRIMAHDVKEPQIYTSFVIGNAEDEKRYSGGVAIARDFVRYLHNHGWKDIKIDNSQGFHKFSMQADKNAGTYNIYRDGELIATGKLTDTKSPLVIAWGDGSGGFRGAVDLSYIGWKFE